MAKRRSKGLGDTIAKISEATGIDKLVKFVAGEDCGCTERKEKLNKLFPYKQVLCLNETEHAYLSHFFAEKRSVLRPTEASAIFKIYDRVTQAKQPTNTSCDSCVRTIVKELKQIFDEYEQEEVQENTK